MWTLDRPTDDYAFFPSKTETPMLEWLTAAMAVLALIGALGLCVCPYFATPKATHDGKLHAAAHPFPFLAGFDGLRSDTERPPYALPRVVAADAKGALRRGYGFDGGAEARSGRLQYATATRLR
jgi:hypothetical protein